MRKRDVAAPAFGLTTRDTASYLAVEGGESETLVLRAALDVEIYVGSLDSYNTISFGGPGAVSYTGDQPAALTTAIDNGDQQSESSNGLFDFSFPARVTSVTFAFSENALEVAAVSVSSAVPEPTTWAMMLLGFAGTNASAPHRSALAPAAQPRPAPPGRALPSEHVSIKGALLSADWGSKFDAD
jgi:hypothetical protein